MTASPLKDSLKSQSGCGKLSGRFVSRLSKDILGMESSDIIYDAGELLRVYRLQVVWR